MYKSATQQKPDSSNWPGSKNYPLYFTRRINVLLPDWLIFKDTSFDSDIHIFRLFINKHLKQLAAYENLLNSGELLRANKFYNAADRERYIIGRGALKQLLARYTNLSPQLVEIISDKNKKPVIKDHSDLHFNVSHSKNCIAFAFSDSDIGIDVEFVNDDFDYRLIAETCFTISEVDYINESCKPKEDFYTLWTRKEALLKATGKGLNDEINKLNCLYDFISEITGSCCNGYRIDSFEIDKNYIAGVAYNLQGKKRKFFEI